MSWIEEFIAANLSSFFSVWATNITHPRQKDKPSQFEGRNKMFARETFLNMSERYYVTSVF